MIVESIRLPRIYAVLDESVWLLVQFQSGYTFSVKTVSSLKGLVIFSYIPQGLRPGLILFRPAGWISCSAVPQPRRVELTASRPSRVDSLP